MAEYDNSVAADGTKISAPSGVITERVGEPSLPSMARGVVKDTMQKLAADSREHNCDICAGLNKDIAVAKAEVMLFVGGIRTTIEGIFAGTSSSPAVEDIKQQISAVKAKVKALKKELEPVQEQIKAVQEYVAEMQRLIAEIQALPAQLQGMFQACLAEATAGLTGAVNDIKAETTGVITEATKAVTDPIKEEIGNITTTVSEAQSVTANTTLS